MPKQHHVFLSYSRVDTAIMQRVRDDLRHAGLQVWTDEGIEPGTTSWKEAIEQAIRHSEMLVVLMSPDSNDSKWVQREIDYADVQGIKVLPLLVRGEPRDAVPFALAGSQFIDMRMQFQHGIQALISLIYHHMHSSKGVTVHYVISPAKKIANRNRLLYASGGIAVIFILLGLVLGTYSLIAPLLISSPTPTPDPTHTIESPASVVAVIFSPTQTPTATATSTTIHTPSPTPIIPTATATHTFTPNPSPTPSGELQLRYNRNTLVVYNRTEEVTSLIGLEFVLIGENGTTERYVFVADEWSAADNRLLAQQCVQVWRTEFATLPLNLNVSGTCESRAAFQSTVRQFWIADWDNAFFEVRRLGILLTSCPAVPSDDNANHSCIVDV